MAPKYKPQQPHAQPSSRKSLSAKGITLQARVFLLLAAFLLTPGELHAGWETGARVGFDSNVNRAIDGGESDTYLGAYLCFLKEASGESRVDWTFLATAEGAAFARINDLSYLSLTLAPGLTFFPYLS